MTYKVFFAVPVLLAACGYVPAYGPETTVEIDGYRIKVSEDFQNGGGEFYAFHPFGQDLSPSDMRRYARNVEAIESVSGCAVDMRTIQNGTYGGTRVAVDCGTPQG